MSAIFYGANITIKHKTTSLYLHSHVERYPLRYEDQRVSSEGQQVTAYPHNDPNNVFQFIAPTNDTYLPTDEEKEKSVRYLRSGDRVRIHHVSTNSFLVTHDVASPLTTSHMEITTLKPDLAELRFNETLWIIGAAGVKVGDKLLTKRHHLLVENVRHKVAIWTGTGLLPKWGFGQNEVNGNKNFKEDGSIWFVNDVVHPLIVNGTTTLTI